MKFALIVRNLVLAVVIVAGFAVIGTSTAVLAQTDPCQTEAGKNSDYCQSLVSNDDPITDTINKVTTVVAWVGGFIAFFWMIIQGIKMSTSYGNPEKVKSARNGIIYGAVGMAVLVLAKFIIFFVLKLIS